MRHCLICDQMVEDKDYSEHNSKHWADGDIKVETGNPYKGKSPEEAKFIEEDLARGAALSAADRKARKNSVATQSRWDRFRSRLRDMWDKTNPPETPPVGYPVDEEGEPAVGRSLDMEDEDE